MSLSRAACLGSRARGLVEAGHVSRFTWRLGPSCRPPDGRGAERRGVADGGPSLEAGMGSFALLGPRAPPANGGEPPFLRSEEHTSELQSQMRISYAVFCLKKKNITRTIYLHNC